MELNQNERKRLRVLPLRTASFSAGAPRPGEVHPRATHFWFGRPGSGRLESPGRLREGAEARTRPSQAGGDGGRGDGGAGPAPASSRRGLVTHYAGAGSRAGQLTPRWSGSGWFGRWWCCRYRAVGGAQDYPWELRDSDPPHRPAEAGTPRAPTTRF